MFTPGRDGLADRQQAAVEIGAVADVGEHMLLGGERLLADPGHALAAHLREADGGTVHPDGHEMAADAGHRARAFGHHGGRVVRAAGAEPGRAVGLAPPAPASSAPWPPASPAARRCGRGCRRPGPACAGARRWRARSAAATGRRWRAAACWPCGLASDHSPPECPGSPSRNLPTTLGRTSSRQSYSCSLTWYSIICRFSSTTRISRRPRANSCVPCASSGHTTPTLCRRMPSRRQVASSRPRSSRACRVSL